MKPLQRVGSVLLGWRYAVLLAWATVWFVIADVTRPRGLLSDWLFFEFGGRTFIHLNSHYGTGALSFYAHYPQIQIGPPPLAIVGGLQWLSLSPAVIRVGVAAVLMLAGLWCLRCVELIVGRQLSAERRRSMQRLLLLAGLVVAPLWAWESARWVHLDDVMAITAMMTAMATITSGKRWWLAALLVGLAVASKPWALITAPCLLGLPREDRARASLVAILAAAACWGPFVLADSQTINALGSFRFTVDGASTLHFLGMPLGYAPRWVRPVQFIGGFLVSLAAVRRRRWAAVPLIGFGFRVVSDPQMWFYYGIGPMVGAVLWDCASPRRLPTWTVATAVVEFGVPTVVPSWSGGVRLVWFVAIAIAVLRPNRTTDPDAPDLVGGTEAVPVPALV